MIGGMRRCISTAAPLTTKRTMEVRIMACDRLPEGSLTARLTDQSTPRVEDLNPRQGIAVLARIYRRLLYSYRPADASDFFTRLDTERDILRLRKELSDGLGA
jgi:hypothetical protein